MDKIQKNVKIKKMKEGIKIKVKGSFNLSSTKIFQHVIIRLFKYHNRKKTKEIK